MPCVWRSSASTSRAAAPGDAEIFGLRTRRGTIERPSPRGAIRARFAANADTFAAGGQTRCCHAAAANGA
jgi:hypothetical protein